MTEVEFSRLLSDLTTTAEKLNVASDSINSIIEKFEADLRKVNVGISVTVKLKSSEDDCVVWSKIYHPSPPPPVGGGGAAGKQEWRLHTESGLLGSRPREVRIAALEAFPAILLELKREAESAIQRIDAARKFVK